RVGPHVRGVALAVRNLVRQRDPPRQIGAGHADVLEPFLDDVDDLVAAMLGLDELRMPRVVLQQGFVVFGQAKKEVRFLYFFRLFWGVWAGPLFSASFPLF